jgi:hypothetical protein
VCQKFILLLQQGLLRSKRQKDGAILKIKNTLLFSLKALFGIKTIAFQKNKHQSRNLSFNIKKSAKKIFKRLQKNFPRMHSPLKKGDLRAGLLKFLYLRATNIKVLCRIIKPPKKR